MWLICNNFFILDYEHQLVLSQAHYFQFHSCDTGNGMAWFLVQGNSAFYWCWAVCLSHSHGNVFCSAAAQFPSWFSTLSRHIRATETSLFPGLWLISVMLLCLFMTSTWRYLIINSVWRLVPRTISAYTQNQSRWLSLWSKIFSFNHHDWLELPDGGGAGDDPVGSEERCWAQT